MSANSHTFTLSFTGDVMLGRLVDQLFPEHVNSPQDQKVAASFIQRYPSSLGEGNYTPSSPWGTTLPLFQNSNLNIINLETAVTTTHEPWPDKKFNYRMHPANLAPILHAAQIDYANLANNHTLDFGSEGLVETAWSLKAAKIAFSGAGETTNQAFKPAKLSLPRREKSQSNSISTNQPGSDSENGYSVHIYSASDHPRDWSSIATFHLIDYAPTTRARLRKLLLSGGMMTHPDETDSESDIYHHTVHHHHDESTNVKKSTPSLKIFSVHWGPNYKWQPADKIRSLAHFLIDECEVDIVHGHSSHHVQGVEVYHGKVILYGCGDFVDDYVLNEEFRNDLGAVWRVVVSEEGPGQGMKMSRLEIFPTRIERFRAILLKSDDADHIWVKRKIVALSRDMNTRVREKLGGEGQIIVDIE